MELHFRADMEWIWRKFLEIEWSGVDLEDSFFIAKTQFTPKDPFSHLGRQKGIGYRYRKHQL